jgi:hypothetical protein
MKLFVATVDVAANPLEDSVKDRSSGVMIVLVVW